MVPIAEAERVVAEIRGHVDAAERQCVAWVLDSSGVTFLAERSARARQLLTAMHREGLWPPRVPTAVLVECLTGQLGRDAAAKRPSEVGDIGALSGDSSAVRIVSL